MNNTNTEEANKILQEKNADFIIAEMTRLSSILEEKGIGFRLDYDPLKEEFSILSKKNEGVWMVQQCCKIEDLLGELYATVGFLLNKKNRYYHAITEIALEQLRKEDAYIKPMLNILKKVNSLPVFAGHTIYLDADTNFSYKLIVDGEVFSSAIKEKEIMREIYAAIAGLVLKL